MPVHDPAHPLRVIACRHLYKYLGPLAHPLVGQMLLVARLLAAYVEVWIIGRHLVGLLDEEVNNGSGR